MKFSSSAPEWMQLYNVQVHVLSSTYPFCTGAGDQDASVDAALRIGLLAMWNGIDAKKTLPTKGLE